MVSAITCKDAAEFKRLMAKPGRTATEQARYSALREKMMAACDGVESRAECAAEARMAK